MPPRGYRQRSNEHHPVIYKAASLFVPRQSSVSRYCSQITLCLALLVLATSAIGQPFTNTVIVQENQKPGTTNWYLTKPAPVGGIEGYASLTSVERGGQISFFVNTTNST